MACITVRGLILCFTRYFVDVQTHEYDFVFMCFVCTKVSSTTLLFWFKPGFHSNAIAALRKRKPQETQALALASSRSWLPLLRPSIPISPANRNARSKQWQPIAFEWKPGLMLGCMSFARRGCPSPSRSRPFRHRYLAHNVSRHP